MRAESSSSSAFEKVMYCLRRVGREPGRFASSMRSCSSVSSLGLVKESAVEMEGWEMEF
jgi:hypothetical protein